MPRMKIAQLQIDRDLFERIIRAEWPKSGQKVTTDAPPDLHIIGFAEGKYSFTAYVISETFADVPEGADPPFVDFVYTVTDG